MWLITRTRSNTSCIRPTLAQRRRSSLTDKVMEAFGGKGYHAETPQELRAALQESFDSGETTLINVTINPDAKRRPQQFAWLTRG